MRFSPSYSKYISTEIPGVSTRGSLKLGPPHNCRGLMSLPHEIENRQPKPWVNKSPDIQGWVHDWLLPYQKEAAHWALGKKGCIFLHPCGSGKTATSLYAAFSSSWSGNKVLVVTKAATRTQWKNETERLTHVSPSILYGHGASGIDKSVRMCVIGWECISAWYDEIRKWSGTGHGFTVIFDEIHMAGHWKRVEKKEGKWVQSTHRSAVASKLGRLAEKRIGLTGTLIRNTLMSAWSPCDIIEPKCWGSSKQYAYRYCAAYEEAGRGLNTKGKSNTQELSTRLGSICDHVSIDLVHRSMPPCRRSLVYLDHADQCKPSKSDTKITAMTTPQIIFEAKISEAASRKRKWLIQAIEEFVTAGQKVVVFTGRRKDCESIAADVKSRLKTTTFWGHGGIPTVDREKLVIDYVAHKGSAVFVGTTHAFGEAIDGFQCTDVAIFVQLPWTPREIVQAEGRFTRHGRTKPVLIMYAIASGTVDEHVADSLLSKLETVSEVTEDDNVLIDILSGSENEEQIIQNIMNKGLKNG